MKLWQFWSIMAAIFCVGMFTTGGRPSVGMATVFAGCVGMLCIEAIFIGLEDK